MIKLDFNKGLFTIQRIETSTCLKCLKSPKIGETKIYKVGSTSYIVTIINAML